MNLLVHFLINILLVLPLNLEKKAIILIGLGGILIDLDHLINVIAVQKIRSPRKMMKFGKQELMLHRPHFYMFHTLEVIGLSMAFAYFFNRYAFLILVGFAIHFCVDALTYIVYYRSFQPWARYFSVFYFIRSRPPK